MVYAELIELIQKKDTTAKKQWFDTFYARFSGICLRYAKSDNQANEMLLPAMHNCYEKLQELRDKSEVEATVIRFFIAECIRFLKSFTSEYYVASTVNAAAKSPPTTYDQTEENDGPDLNTVETAVLIEALRELPPAQRLVYNLHVIDGFSLAVAAGMMESSEATLKSNLEKARFGFQKNIVNRLKSTTK